MSPESSTQALSFASVADAYDRARPSYPGDAASWLIGTSPARVLELGAGTGRLTEMLLAGGHEVIATDPLPEMLAHLRRRLPAAQVAVGTAENIPIPSRSVDVIVCAQAFHWFDHPVAMAEIARVLRPGGVLAVVWNSRDEGIPWVRRLGALLNGMGDGEGHADLTDLADPLRNSELFGFVESREFRFWQALRKDELFDLIRSRSYVAVLPDSERDALLDRVGSLYDEYGRGPDGMQLPYLTRCYRTTVTNQPPAPVVVTPVRGPVADDIDPDATQAMRRPAPAVPEDTGTLLIDFK